MSLTLDEVRNIKFRMAKRSGYEVLDVDEFVDHVEEGIARLLEENETLKRQVSALQSGQPEHSGDGQQTPDQAEAQPTQDDHTEDRQDSEQRSDEPVAQTAQPQAVAAPVESVGRETIVVTTSKEASAAVVRLVEMSTDQAEKLMGEAEDDAKRIRDEANRTAHQVTTDARTRAERIESEARVNADRVRSEAQTRSDQLDQETASRREELFGGLEHERDNLTDAVAELREFEQEYRQNLSSHLQQQLDTVSGLNASPERRPSLLESGGPQGRRASGSGSAGQGNDSRPTPSSNGQDGSTGSDTPRLDALLGDQH